MHGVIRFLDTPLFPASTPEDYPKVVKSGIDEEGQHPKSPVVTGPDGIATLLHRIGRQQLFERLLDVSGTEEFSLRVRTEGHFLSDLYVKRIAHEVEYGFINREGQWAQPGMRFRIEVCPADSPYPIAQWTPVSTSDLDSGWGGTEHWVRAQGTAFAKAIWYNSYWNFPDIDVSWTDMSPADEEEIALWLKERAEGLKVVSDKEGEEYEERKKTLGDKFHLEEERMGMQTYYKSKMACRAHCGEKNPKLVCSKCKTTRYCSPECQKDDWRFHKTYCGTETPVPAEYK